MPFTYSRQYDDRRHREILVVSLGKSYCQLERVVGCGAKWHDAVGALLSVPRAKELLQERQK